MRLGVGGARPRSPQYSCPQPEVEHRHSIDLSSSPIRRPSWSGFAHVVEESPWGLNLPAQTSEGLWFNISAPREIDYAGVAEGN